MQLEVWKDVLIIRGVPVDWLPFSERIKYNGKFKAHICSLSFQNLTYLSNILGQNIKPFFKKGYNKVEGLKQAYHDYKTSICNVNTVKTCKNLPYYPFKVPPLGDYQHRGVWFLMENPTAPLFADCGCLAGDTKIRFRRAGANCCMTIRDLYKSQEKTGSIHLRRGKTHTIEIKSFKEDVIGYHNAVTVLKKGNKKVVELLLENKSSIKATPDHEFLTREGWRRLDKLIPEQDFVMISADVKNKVLKVTDVKPAFSKVVSIKPAGHEDTYDLVCEDPYRNFVANGMVVHNCGKTYMTIVSTELQIKEGIIPSGGTLVCGKLATLETGWMDDIRKFSDLKASLVYSHSSYKRKEKLLKALDEPADIYITNHDTVRTIKDALVAKRFKKIIVDESTILKSYRGDGLSGGAFAKALCEVANESTHRVIMSGTPAPNGPEDLWGQFKFLDQWGFIFEPTYRDFKTKYMIEEEFGTYNTFTTFTFDGEQLPELKKKISEVAYQIRIRDHLLELPERTIQKRVVRMSPAQQGHYDAMHELLSTVIHDELVSVDEILARIIKLRQITGGFLIDQEGKAHPIEGATKIDALDDLLEEIGIFAKQPEKVVIYAQYRWEIETIETRYKDYGAVSVYGGNSSKKNLESIKRFIDDRDVRIIVLHPRSAAHGVTFTVSHYMVFYSISYSAEENYQCIKRIERAGQNHPMFVYYLLAEHSSYKERTLPTIDFAIYSVIIEKEKNQAVLIDQSKVNRSILKTYKN